MKLSVFNGPLQKIGIRPAIDGRPGAWAASGTTCMESSDYRACANFGPLHG